LNRIRRGIVRAFGRRARRRKGFWHGIPLVTARIKVFFDGGCRPNPGAMELAVVAAGQTHLRRDLGQGTSTEAEWLALIEALRIARSLGSPFVLLGDARHVIGPASGAMPGRGAGFAPWQAYREAVGDGPPPLVRYVGRAQNLAGIALARLHPR
jgi:ribonuclease HI